MDLAIIIDDLAADRVLATRVLRDAGWTVYQARNSVEGDKLVAQVLDERNTARAVIVTDLHMPTDPSYRSADRRTAAGSQWALRLRAQMEHHALPRVPIVALTALTEREVHTTALAFGCDAVLLKPITPNLAERIILGLAQASAEDAAPVGADVLLALLRCHLAEATLVPTSRDPGLTEQNITKALLAYHRRGLIGLGESALAVWLAPHISSSIERGESVFALLTRSLEQIRLLGAHESLDILHGELLNQLSPQEQCADLGLSLSEYYRRRREAALALLDLLTQSGREA